ncbi:putative membrane protein [plant metagenome]|uniref:Putative membrane protein n=1 Tax=plant metagenome TaxID=1297885 RepID=A0A484Q9X5_9ZZZZ
MKLRMARNSIFAILLRSAWWISAAIAAAIVIAANALLPPQYFGFGAFAAFPFVIIAGIALYKQLQRPSEARVAEIENAARAMSWQAFSQALADAFTRDGSQVETLNGDPRADFALTRNGRRAVVAARRWKASRTGLEALRELVAAREAHAAHECIYVAMGDLSEQAARYAKQEQVHLLQGTELARLAPKFAQAR